MGVYGSSDYPKLNERKTMKQYEVVISESVAKYVIIKAKTEKEAIQKASQGYYTNDDITNEECLDRSIESADEVIE